MTPPILDPEFIGRNRISLFCSLIPLLGIPLFFFLRNGFDDKFYSEVFKSAGIALFVLFTPLLLITKLKSRKSFFKSESLILLAFLVGLCFVHVIPYSSYAIIFIGVVSFIICLYYFIRKERLSLKLLVAATLATCFAIWVLFKVCAVERPTLFESLSVNRNVLQAQDLFFHTAISHIIKNYGIPSTGLQGTPYAYYHFGSHWFFAQISKLTEFHIIRTYLTFYPFVIIPCFFKTFLTFSRDVRRALGSKSDFSILSIIFLFCLFLGIPNHLYAQGFFDTSILGLESLVFSFVLLFILGSIWINLYLRNKTLNRFSSDENIFVMVISPLIFLCIGLVKISTLFVILGPFFLLIVRFGHWKDSIGISFYITLIASVLVYFYVAETIPFGIRTHGHEGGFSFGNAYASMTAEKLFKPLHWFVMFFLWTYLTISCVLLAKLKLSLAKDLDPVGLTTMMFVSIASAIFGLLPTFVLSFNGANAMFFVTIQMFLSGCFMIALAPTIQSVITSRRLTRVPFFAFCILLFLISYKKIRFTAKEILLENLNTRILISDKDAVPNIRFSLNRDLKTIWNGFPDVQNKINGNSLYQVLKNTEKLAYLNVPLRSSTLLFVEDYVNGQPIEGTEQLNCLEKSFLIPALSGYALLNGAIYNCSIGSYGEAYYNYPGQVQDSSMVTVCNGALGKGFKQVVSYNVKENSVRPLDCNLTLSEPMN